MPITDALILGAIVIAFAVFGTVLAWAEYQTRHISAGRAEQAERVPQNQSTTVVRLKTAHAMELLGS
jgi:multisubunit Na+/H+ antiporter MnhC subunit